MVRVHRSRPNIWLSGTPAFMSWSRVSRQRSMVWVSRSYQGRNAGPKSVSKLTNSAAVGPSDGPRTAKTSSGFKS